MARTTAGLAFIGFGEAAMAFAGDLPASARAYDIRGGDAAKQADLRRHGVHGAATNAEAVADAAIILSLVTAHQALAAARETARSIVPGALYCDMNSVAPATKQAACDLIETAGGCYVDVAVMAPVLPARRSVLMLASGPHAAIACAALGEWGFRPRAVAGAVGAASAVKMIRSVLVKGLEALTTECFLAAEAAGVTAEVAASLDTSWPGADWAAKADYNLERMMVHGLRRAAEMDEVVRTLDALGTSSDMARAAAGCQLAIGERRIDPPAGLAGKAALLLAREGGPGVIIDCHGHYTTAPAAHDAWRALQTAAFKAGGAPPSYPAISDDEIRETIESNQLRLLRERGADATIFSPRASAMAHHLCDEEVSRAWTRACNDLIGRVAGLYPGIFFGVCQLPQSPGVPIENSIGELERCVTELGFVGCNLNPDPSGGHFSSPPLTDRFWYPFYEKMVELDVPAMIHVSGSCNLAFHATGGYYIAADTAAFMQFVQGDLFSDFPALRFVIPHGGGAVPYHWGRYRGLADMLGQPALGGHVMRNVWFDTCVYHQPGIDLLFEVIDIDNILFGSEMVGAVRGIDPETGFHFDDTKRYIDALPISAADKAKVFSGNARRVYPRLDAQLKARGL